MPRIYNDDGTYRDVEHINFYLLAGSDIFVESRTTPLCPVPKMVKGSQPTDGGNLLLNSDERDELLKKCPQAEKYVRQFLGADEFINNKKRYCLWLVDCPPNEIRKMKPIYERVKKVAEFRKKSKKIPTQKAADIPHLFTENRQPKETYILVPRHSSGVRKYIPMDFLSAEIICGDSNLMIPDAELWHFGILTSSVHMIWMKTVAGYLGTSYRYSAKLVYNNFVWLKMEFADYMRLNLSAQKILKARQKYLFREEGEGKREEEKSLVPNPCSLIPKCSLADLYDETTMPKDLRAAHRENDRNVMKIYGFDESMSEEEIAVQLLMRYEELKNYLAGK